MDNKNEHYYRILEESVQRELFKRYIRMDVMDEMNRFGKTMRMAVRFPSGNMIFNMARIDMMDVMQGGQGIRVIEALGIDMIHNMFHTMETWIKIAKDELKFSDILAIRDIEQRMVALKRYGVEKMLHDANAQVINKSKRGNELYRIPAEKKIFSQDAYYLKYSDPSTGRIYISGVPPEMGITGDADACMAWKHGLSLQAYQLLTNEA